MSSRLERVSRVAATMRNDDKSRTGKLRRLNGESTLDTVRARSEAAQKKANEEEAIRRARYDAQVAAQRQATVATPAERYAAERGNRWSSDVYNNKGMMPTTATSKDVGVTSSPSRQRIAKDAEDTEMLDRIIEAKENKDTSVENAYLVDKYKKSKGYTANNPRAKEYEAEYERNKAKIEQINSTMTENPNRKMSQFIADGSLDERKKLEARNKEIEKILSTNWGEEQFNKDVEARRREKNKQDLWDKWGLEYYALPDNDKKGFETVAKSEGSSTVDKIIGGFDPDTRKAKKYLKGKYTAEQIDAYSQIAKDITDYETYQKEQAAYRDVQNKLANTDDEGKALLDDVYAYNQSNNFVTNVIRALSSNYDDESLMREEGNEKANLEKNKNAAVQALKDTYGYTDDEITILSIYNAYNQNKIDKEEYMGDLEKFAKDHPAWSWILTAATQTAGGIAGFGGYINDIQDAKRLESAGYEGKITAQGANNPLNAVSNFGNAAREVNADKKVLGLDYGMTLDMANSITNRLVNMLAPGIGNLSFFFSAFNEGNAEAAERGADIYHSGAYGTAKGINEVLFESLSWGAIDKIADFTGGVIKGGNLASKVFYFLAQRFADGGVNFTEELNTEAANVIADFIINGDFSQYGMIANQMLSEGYSEEETSDTVAKQIANQLLQAGKGGFVQGLIMGGGNQLIRSAMNASQNNRQGMALRLGDDYSIKSMTQQISNEIISQGYESENSAEALAEGIAKLATGGKVNSSVQAEINQSEFLTSLLNDATAAVQSNTEIINQTAREMGITPQGNSNRNVANTVRLEAAREAQATRVKSADLYNQFREQGASGIESAVKAYKASKLNEKLSNYEYDNLTRQEREDAINRGELSQAITQAKEKKASENKSDLASFAKIRDAIGEAEETRQKISNTGETTLSDSGEAVKSYKVSNIERIADNETGEYADVKIEVTLDNGKTKIVSPTDIDYSNNAQAKAIDVLTTVATATDIDTETANFILNSVPLISQNYSERTIATAIRTAYDYGKYNLPIGTYGQTSVGILGEDLFNSIKKYGAEALESETAELTKSIAAATAINKGKTGKATFKGKELSYESIDNDNSLNKTQKDELKHAVFIAEVTGLEVEAFESTEDERKAGKENGYFNGNVLAIDINAGTEGKLMFTLAHELTHFIKQWSPEQFNNLAKFVMDKYGQQGVDVEGLIESKIRNAKKRKLSRAAAYEEVVCDAMESMLTDDRKTVIKNLAELNRDNPELFNKLNGEIERIGDNVSKKYNEFIKSNKEISREGKYIANAKEDIDKLRKMFAEALQKAGENYRKAGGTVEGKNLNTKFQDREPIEETKNLLAIHNTTEEKLFASLQMGGFPMPSIAIVKDTMGHDKFGGISVVFGKDTIDPALPNNKVYGSDAYTPTRISVEHKVNSKAINSIHDKVKEMIEREGISYNDLPYSGLDSQNAEDKLNRNQGDIYDAYGTTDALKIAYASEKGIPFIKQYFEKQINPRLDNEIVKMLMSDSAFMERIKEYINNDEYIDPNNISEDTVYDLLKFINKACQEYYQLDNDELYTYNRFGKYETSEMLNSIRRITQEGIPRTFDNRTAVDSINEAISKDDRKDYKNWLNELFEGVVEKKGIRNKTDLFTPSGKRRSFEQLHWEYTLENIVRAMKSQDFQKGQTFGGVSITGSATRNFKNLKEIKENSSKLNLETEKEFNDKQREFGDRFHNLAYEFAGNGDYRSADGCEEVMVEAINKYSNLNLDSIKAYLKRESQGWANYKDSIAEELVKLVKDIRDMPTGYFEAKPQRAVGLGEIKAVVVPSNVSPRLKTWLSNRGINNIVEYEAGNEKDRLAKLNSIEDVKFQERNDSAIDDEYSYVLEKYGEDSWQVADIINKAAVRAGYNSPKLWHGTNKFGFTWFDLNRMDDKQSIFLTSSPIMASSYSGKTGTRKISSYDRRDISKLHGKELVDKANEAFREAGVAFAPFKYYSKKELRQKLENYAKLEKETISILEKGVKEKTELINQIGAGAYSSDMLNKIAHVEAGIEYLKNHNAAKARQELNAFASYVVSDFEQNRTVLENVFELKQLDDIYLKSENLTEDGGAIFHLGVFASEEEARENAYKAPAEGNYQLKAKLGKSLVVDAEGANWNKVPFNLNQLGDISNYDYYQAGDRFVLVNAETGELLEGRSYTADTDKWLYSPSVEKLKEIYREAGEWNHDSILKALYTMAKDEDERLEIFNTARTRDIADWAKRNGYDSVVFQNLYDDGGRGNGQPIPMADVYVIFDPNAVKSIDPVTYDDDGNIIPPSQRFNEEEKDFRYQERSTMTNEQVDKVTESLYTYLTDNRASTNNDSINKWVFNKRIFSKAEIANFEQQASNLSRNKDKFESIKTPYGDYMLIVENKIVYTDGDEDNPYISEILEVATQYGKDVEWLRKVLIENAKRLQSSNGIHGTAYRDFIREKFVIRYRAGDSRPSDLKTGKGLGSNRETALQNCIRKQYRAGNIAENQGNELIRFYEERSIGNDGALSDAKNQEREAPEERELPYFLDKQEQDEVFAILEEMNRARDEIFNGGELSDDEEFWNAKTVPENSRDGVRTLNKGQRQRVKRETVYQLIRKYKKKFAEKGSPFSLENVDKATDLLQKLYEDMQNDSNIAWEEAYSRARDVAIEIVKYTNWYDEIVHPGKNYERRIRQRRFNPYGRLRDDEGNDTSKGNNFLVEDEFLLTPIINEILTDYFDLPVSNAAAVKRASIKANYENKIGELKRQLKDLEKERRELVKDKTKAERRAIIEQRRNERYHETVEKRNQKAQIKKVADSIIKKLKANGDQSTKHIPESLKNSVLNFAEIINEAGVFDSEKREKLSRSLVSLSNALERNSDADENNDSNMMSMYDEELKAAVSKLAENIGENKLSELSSAELKEIKEITRYIRHIIVNANKAFSANIKEGISEMGQTAYNEIALKKPSKIFYWGMQTGMLKPVTFFDMLGSKTLSRLYQNIREGELKWYRVIEDAKQFRIDTQKQFNYDEWKDQTVTVPVRDGSVKMPMEEALALYATITRSNEQGAGHLLKGGFSTKTVKDQRMTADDMASFIGSLTDEQKGYAEAMIEYLSRDMASLGNEVTMKLYGVRKFLEDHYFPLSSDPNSLYEDGGGSLGKVDNRIKHFSMTKELTKNASNPLAIGRFTDTCMRHCSDMGLYYGLCLPMEDFNRVYNYKGAMPNEDQGGTQTNIKKAIEKAFPAHQDKKNENDPDVNNALSYISTLRADINGKAGRDSARDMVRKMISLSKKGAVFASASVAIQQPSAVARAFRYINPKYFVKTTFTKRDYEECKKWCAVAGIKEMGFFDTGVGRTATEWMTQGEYPTLKEKGKAIFTDSAYRDELLSKLPSVMDEITWSHIWNACKEEIKDTTDLKEGSEEFYRAAAERFTFVIDRTQVYDSVFSRSEFMRSKDTGAQVMTAFMAEPTTALNMLYSASFGTLYNGETRKQAVGKATNAFLASVVLNSLLKSIVTAARHAGKDDNDEKSLLEIYVEEFFNNAMDDVILLNYIPYLKDLYSAFQGYDSERMDTTAITKVVDAYKAAVKDGFSYKSVKAIAGAIGLLTGVPVSNVWRDIEAATSIGERMIDAIQGEGRKTTPSGIGKAIASGANPLPSNGSPIKKEATKMVKQYLKGDMENYRKTREALKGENASTVKSHIVTYLREQYVEDKLTDYEVRRVLEYVYGMSSTNISKKLEEFRQRKNGTYEKKESKKWGED